MTIDRRDTLKLAGFVFASGLLFPDTPVEARMWQADHDKNYYPVSPQHAVEIDRAFGDTWPTLDHSEHVRLTLALMSEQRRLTDDERAKIRAADYLRNMNSAVRFLDGRDHRQMFTYIDQVHGNRLLADCGCQLTFCFDHHLRTEPALLTHYPHYPIYVCDDHKHLSNDWEQHFVTVVNQGRENIA